MDSEHLNELRSQGLDSVMERIEKRVLEGFRDELGELPQDAAMIKSVRVVQGDPPQMILDETEKLAVDLIVAGSHSHDIQFDTPLGRTAARLVQLAEVPVYLVPMLQHRGAISGLSVVY